MNYILKISARNVFRSNLRNVFVLSKKKAVNYNFHVVMVSVFLCFSLAFSFRYSYWLSLFHSFVALRLTV